MNSQDYQNTNLPDTPGVYFFLGDKRKILYIGKATSLKDRVKSYFSKDLINTRGPRLVQMLEKTTNIKFLETQSVLEALILEANQIKKHQPYFNSKEKDDRSYNYVTITDEDFPQIFITRGHGTYGPFPNGSELREALKIIRRIFPYRDNKCSMKKPCFNSQIGLCPGVCAGLMNKRDYRRRIKYIKLFFEAKKDLLIKDLEKEMQSLSKRELFEEAEKIKRTIYALDHIQDVALIKRDIERGDNQNSFRIEAYDIAHMSGQNTVGVMTVVIDGELAKDQYRKFKIIGQNKKINIDDTANLKEVIRRRLGHIEWPLPNLIVIDGSTAQINAARSILIERGFLIEIVAVVKDERHRAKEIVGLKHTINSWNKSIILANAEAHRFAITYHRKLRSKGFRI
jgi:excinuclease ABC subunit C